MIQAKLLPSIDSLGLDEMGWNVLADGSETNTVFQTHHGALTWEKVYGDQYEPWCISVADAKHLSGPALIRYVIGHASEQKRPEFDIATGDEEFTCRYSDIMRKTAHPKFVRSPYQVFLYYSGHKPGIVVRGLS